MSYPSSQHSKVHRTTWGMLWSDAKRPGVRPGRVWYLLVFLVLLGSGAWLASSIASLVTQVDSFPRVSLPTSGSPVSLTHAGSYVVYYEAPGAATGPLPSFHVQIAPDSAGAAATSLTTYASQVTYNFGAHEGRAALTLQISSPGKFRVIAPGAPSGSDLAFGSGIVGGIVGVGVPSIMLMAASVIGLVVIAIMRSRGRSRLRSATGGMWSPAGPGYPGDQTIS